MKNYILTIFTLLFLLGCSTTTNSVIEDDEDVTSSSEKIESSSSKGLSSNSHNQGPEEIPDSISNDIVFSNSSNAGSSSSTNIPSFEEILDDTISSSSSSESSSSSSYLPSLNEIYQNINESATCTTRDSIAAYLCKFDHLPSNYVTKDKGIALYEKQGNTFSKWNFNPWTTIGVMIGGDEFFNREGLLPQASYHEADLQYNASNRGTKRLVYQGNCVIYYTADHYETFTQLFPKE